MPELNDVLETQVVNVTTIETKPKSEEIIVTNEIPDKKPKAKIPVKSPKKSSSTENTPRRPPFEQLVKDFEKHILTLKIGDNPIKKLGYKCGKIIYGLENNNNSKDFRVIAFKARKKTKTVEGKSRCIFYFGITKDTNNIINQHAGTSSTEFGSCSVQAKKPIQLVLDKTTFSEVYEQNIEKVINTLKSLCAITIEHKTEQWIEKTVTAEKKSKKKTTDTTADAE